MTGNSPSTGHPAQGAMPCPLCYWPLSSHDPFVAERHVSLAAKAAETWSVVSQVSLRETAAHPLRVVGSSSTTTGSTRSRGTFGTASSSLASRRLRRTRSGASSTSGRSLAGTASGRTSGSSKPSWTETGGSIGQEVRTPAEWCATGHHLWGYEPSIPEDVFCIRGCGARWA